MRFALVQDIWIDESTQLSGVRLPIVDLVAWLSGSDTARFGVPGDRMPPLAYLLDHLWWQASGDAELRFRMFHMLLATCGLAVVAYTERETMGRYWLGVGLAFLVLCPKLIEESVELRSYPLFFAVACGLVALFLKIVKREQPLPTWRELLLFGGGCVVLSYIHFFGVVAAFAFFATLVLAFARNRAALWRVLIVGALLAACLVGLYPFVFGATSVSDDGASMAPGDVLHYFPSLFGHPALLIFPAAGLLYFIASGLLLAAAAYGAGRRAAQRRPEAIDWLVIVAVIGCVATIVPGFLISTFSALKPNYSLWLVPVLALLIAQGASKPIGLRLWDRHGRAGAVAVMLIGGAMATGVFLARAQWFVHGPHRVIEAARELSPASSAILYAEPATFAFGYFPMVYQTYGRVPQWLAQPDGTVARMGNDGASPAQPLSALAPYSGLVVVDIRPRHFSALRECLYGRCPAFPSPPLIDALVRSGRWSVASQVRAFGFYDAVVTRMAPNP